MLYLYLRYSTEKVLSGGYLVANVGVGACSAERGAGKIRRSGDGRKSEQNGEKDEGEIAFVLGPM